MTQGENTEQSLSFVNGVLSCNPLIEDRGFAFGDGLFESMLFCNGGIPLLEFHLARLSSDSARLKIPLDQNSLKEQLLQLVASAKQSEISTAKIKIILTRGVGGAGCYPPSVTLNPNIVLSLSVIEFPSAISELNLLTSSVHLPHVPLLAGIKHLNRLVYILGAQLDRAENQEVLFLDQDQHVIETMHHNVFLVQGATLLTPTLKTCGVRGVMRTLVMQKLAKKIGFEVREVSLFLSDLVASEAVFICNAVRGFTRINEIDGVKIKGGGNTTCLRLQSALDNFKENI